MDTQLKIGVFFCACGHILDDYFDMKALIDYSSRMAGVVLVDENRFLCTKTGMDWLKTKIRQSGCNRVVIVGCSPYQYETNFRRALEEAGLNPYFLAIANIREGCAWVCAERENLMSSARQIISAAIRRVSFAKPVERVKKDIQRSALVIGAGLTGIEMALELERLKIRPILIERKTQVSRKNPPFFIPSIQGVNEGEMFSSKIKELRDRKIELLTSAEIKGVKGQIGSFEVTLDSMGQEKKLEVGAIIVSTGSQSRVGAKLRSLPTSRRIVTLSQLREMFDFEKRTLERILLTQDKRTKYACFILGEGEGFTKTTTLMALNEALRLKEEFKAEVIVAAKDISVSGTELEAFYQQARGRGILFYRYTKDSAPEISLDQGMITVKLLDPALMKKGAGCGCGSGLIAVNSDLLVLEDEVLPSEGVEELRDILKVNTNQWGFFQEKNIHLKPNLSNKKGIFFAGSCLGERDIYETLNDIRSVAMSVYSYLSQGCLEMDKKVVINPDKCALCLTCFRTCPHKAIEIGDTEGGQKWGARISVETCQGCGICVGECPAKAIEMITYSDSQIFGELVFEG